MLLTTNALKSQGWSRISTGRDKRDIMVGRADAGVETRDMKHATQEKRHEVQEET